MWAVTDPVSLGTGSDTDSEHEHRVCLPYSAAGPSIQTWWWYRLDEETGWGLDGCKEEASVEHRLGELEVSEMEEGLVTIAGETAADNIRAGKAILLA